MHQPTTTRLSIATTRLVPDAPPTLYRSIVAIMVALLVAGAVYGTPALLTWHTAYTKPLAPIIILATSMPTPGPARVAPRYVVAFDQPNGTALGAVPEPTQFSARYGAGWLLTPCQGGAVWVRAGDLTHAPSAFVDLQPTATVAAPIIMVMADSPKGESAPAAPAVTVAAPTSATAQPMIVTYTNPDGSTFARYACQPYGDWRDTSAVYAHPECAGH
jgi:hypothetical protein